MSADHVGQAVLQASRMDQADATRHTGRWEHFPHGADIGVRGIGRSLSEAFAEAARAVTAAAVDPDQVHAEFPVEITCVGESAEDLFYTWLNAVIYEMATRRMLFGRFYVELDGYRLRATAWGERVRRDRHQPAVEAKGATYTELAVRHENDHWIAQCVVDV